MITETQRSVFQALASMTTGVVKMGAALKAKIEAAPKPIDNALVEKAAAALVENGWITEEQRPGALGILTDPNEALKVLEQMAKKAADEIAKVRGETDPKAGAGKPVARIDGSGTVKQAAVRATPSYDPSDNPAAQLMRDKTLGYRQMMAQNS